jgi:histone-binding protein RBBP4
VLEKIQHNGEINRARYCPADHRLMAIASNKGDIILTNFKEQVAKLVGHTAEGYGISWNNINKNLLLSGFTDRRICIWDIEKNKQENQKILPIF